MKKLILVSLMSMGLTACGSSETVGAKFSSIRGCLEAIQSHAKSKVSFIAVDESTKVTGTLSNGANFGCELRNTGTQGIFVEGWYTVYK